MFNVREVKSCKPVLPEGKREKSFSFPQCSEKIREEPSFNAWTNDGGVLPATTLFFL